ncbi:ribonuclease H-like domain-containing protein, partial [Tanacetum coccineum]
MLDEYNALITNGTWVLIPRLANISVVCFMWLFNNKFHAHGSLSRYKARLVSNGRSKQQGIDCDETFGPVVKLVTIRTILSLAVHWVISSLHVEFSMTDLGSLNYFLGISTQWTLTDMFLLQLKYVEEILERAHMQHCNPYISYVVQQVCLYTHDPRETHFAVLKQILR